MIDAQVTNQQCYLRSFFQFGIYKRPPKFCGTFNNISRTDSNVTTKEHFEIQHTIKSFQDERLIQKHKRDNFVKRNDELEQARIEIVIRLGMAAEYRDEETGRHIKRMSRFCRLLGAAIGLSKEETFLLELAATMHDVGKIGISDSILFKQDKLTSDERSAMQQHTIIGAKLLANSNSKILQLAEQIALTHHEKWDGSGYPLGLKGDQIPIAGRITCICDVFDALISNRPYKRAWTLERAIQEIKARSGSDFDPSLVMRMVGLEPDLRKVIKMFGVTQQSP